MPNTITVSYSELDAYRQCPLKHQLGYIQLWSKEQGEGSALNRGSAWHAILETHYGVIQEMRTKPDGRWLASPSKATTQAILERAATFVWRQHLMHPNGEQTEQQELLQWMYDGHLQQYGLDETWQILGVERAGKVWLRTEAGGRSRFLLKYKIDLVILDLETGQLKVVDHKSAADFSRQVEIDIDDQFGLYTGAYWRETGRRPICIVRSDARTKRNKGSMTLDQRFQRIQTFRSDRELRNIEIDAYNTARAAFMPGKPIHSSPAPDRCKWRCDFLEAHLAMRKGIASPERILQDFGFERREVKHREYTKEEGQD